MRAGRQRSPAAHCGRAPLWGRTLNLPPPEGSSLAVQTGGQRINSISFCISLCINLAPIKRPQSLAIVKGSLSFN